MKLFGIDFGGKDNAPSQQDQQPVDPNASTETVNDHAEVPGHVEQSATDSPAFGVDSAPAEDPTSNPVAEPAPLDEAPAPMGDAGMPSGEAPAPGDQPPAMPQDQNGPPTSLAA